MSYNFLLIFLRENFIFLFNQAKHIQTSANAICVEFYSVILRMTTYVSFVGIATMLALKVSTLGKMLLWKMGELVILILLVSRSSKEAHAYLT